MPIEMPKGLPFSVDTWTSASMRKRHHFLTHAHKDHSSGISSLSSFPIYCTYFTKTLVRQHYTQLEDSLFVGIEVGQSIVIDDPDGAFTVTAFDANHCPGAVMFLFEGNFGNILHTGDCRLSPECLQNLPEKYIGKKGKEPRCQLDCVFLDCTFGSFFQEMPSKHSAVQEVINCIWKHHNALTVYLSCDLLGQEEILVNVSKTFGAKIYVDKSKNPECFQNLTLAAPEILSEDPSSRFHIFDGSPGLYERAYVKLAEARHNHQSEPLIIRPSAQWYACEDRFSELENTKKKRTHGAVKDQFGVWHVCYSMHSSKEELEWALQLLSPRWVVSTTPSCRAMELDYVKRHCFKSNIALNKSLCKLLDMTVETSLDAGTLVKSLNSKHVLEMTPQPCAQTQPPGKQSNETRALIEVSPPGKLPVTLFGRARLGFQDVNFSHGGCNSVPTSGLSQTVSSNTGQESFYQEKDDEVKLDKLQESTNDLYKVKYQQSQDQETRVRKSTTYLNIGSSGFSEGVRKLYRLMNVPVPEPLPSLVGLLNRNKRLKRG
ncbi:5' exonuclease Apollo [Neltuma alba]|uniref:5' exonuclease Apollo n=1 Tax=Neltuma alba TaxID=207710 RepID=UPI0010A3C28B|nr:5' exonuclease Apollo [Prosopis alba]